MRVYANRYRESDPLFYSVPDPKDKAPEGWYFWDETFQKAYGPYASYEIAGNNLQVYIEIYIEDKQLLDDEKDKETR